MDFSAMDGHQDMLPPGVPDVATLRKDARILLAQIDARERLGTRRVIPLPSGMWNALYRLEPAGLVAKLSFMGNAFEVDFLRDAAELGVPVPRIYSAGPLEHAEIPAACYFLMSYEANTANAWQFLHQHHQLSLDDLRLLGADLGAILARLHTRRLGYLTHFNTRIDRWQQALTDGFSPDWENPAQNSLFDHELLAALRRLLRETRYFEFSDGAFCHGDLVLTNVLVDTETHRLRAIIDPGNYAGMPMFDLAYAAMPWDHGFGFHDALLDAYKSRAVFDSVYYAVSQLVVAYRHARFHTPQVREYIHDSLLPLLP